MPSTTFVSGVALNMYGVRLEKLNFEKNQNLELQGQKLRPKCHNKKNHKRNMDLCRRLVRYENSWVVISLVNWCFSLVSYHTNNNFDDSRKVYGPEK